MFVSLPALRMLLKLCPQRLQSHFSASQIGFKTVKAGRLKHDTCLIAFQHNKPGQIMLTYDQKHVCLSVHSCKIGNSKTEKRKSPSRELKGMTFSNS